MSFKLSKEVLDYLESSFDEVLELLEELCKIPAPSGHEQERAEFCKKWLEDNGAEGVLIDSALNVVYPVGCEKSNDIVVFMAHTDTVFPNVEYPMPYRHDGKYIYSPGVADDTICVVIMLIVARYIAQKKLKPARGILFVANSCEEGLGNLKGVKQIMADYAGRISEVYTFDERYDQLVNVCVGSHRYKVTFETEGGHSFTAFGNKSAIEAMSEFICRLYRKEVPVIDGSKTTYNVGIVEGGTSVNTIAQSASMMYEYRSDSRECLAEMQAFFESEIERTKADGEVKITVETIGVRPCSGEVDENKLCEMTQKAKDICQKYSGMECMVKSASTDCNIPMSMGIPAVCVGVYLGGGTHTREEYLEIESIPVGLKIAAELILGYLC